MKGIILSGGLGTRLYPMTYAVSKQLLPVYNVPMIYYPISILYKSGIKDITLITNPEYVLTFKKALQGLVNEVGINLKIIPQANPTGGIAEALLLGLEEGKDDNEESVLILGDNIFIMTGQIQNTIPSCPGKCCLFTVYSDTPYRFGVINEFRTRITEKPSNPETNRIVTGLYKYPAGVRKVAESIKRSPRRELEITDVNNYYLGIGEAKVFDVGVENEHWFDCGTPDSLLDASNKLKKIYDEYNYQLF